MPAAKPIGASLALLFAVAALAGCGGGAGGGGVTPTPPPPPPPPAAATACDGAPGRVLEVGPGKTYSLPSAAAAAAQNGDVVRIAAGTYLGDVAIWRANDLTICGIGGRAVLRADGRNAQGKAIWVTVGSNITIDSLEFRDATVPDQNGAGIRAEGAGLRILNSGFFDNENGILGGAGVVSIDRSEFARNGFGDGYTHNIYILRAERLEVTNSFFHEAKIGHNLKSRAQQTVIENSYFMDGPTGTSSYLVDTPNGGVVVLRGNLFHKGPNADNSTAISFGAEGLAWPTNTLTMVHNTVVITRPGGAFVSAPAATQSITFTANVFAGTNGPALLTGSFALASVLQQNNVVDGAGAIPGGANVAAPNFWPDATLRARLALPGMADAGYTHDAPSPFVRREIAGTARLAGALQAAP